MSSPSVSRGETLAVLGLALLAIALQISAIREQSLSSDGAYHLLAGHQALRYGQNSLNLEHPPLVKLAVAIPLLVEEPLLPPIRVEDALPAANRIYQQDEKLQRATIRGRAVALVVFVLPFFWACYALGKRFGDKTVGTVLALMVALSISVLPYLTVLQTDVAVALAFVLTLLATIRYVEGPSFWRAAVLGACVGFGLAVKFSAILLGPTVVLGLLAARADWRKKITGLALASVVTLGVVEVVYMAANRSYSSELGREVIRAYCENRGTLTVGDHMSGSARTLLAIERWNPRLAQWATGFWGVRLQNEIGVYPSYAFGEVQSAGRWWYFPAVLMIKTPLPILIASLVGLTAWARRRNRGEPRRDWAWRLLAITVAVYFVTAMTSNYNLSVRHMLPIIPMLYLPAARLVSRRRWARAGVIVLLATECVMLAPLWMSATNTWWLGSLNPTRFSLAAGNLEYRQNFIQLARYVEEHGIEQLGVLYPSVHPDVIHSYLPNARVVEAGDDLPPGWYAVSVVVEQFVPALLAAERGQVWDFENLRDAAERWLPTWEAVKQGEDHGYVAGTFHLYRVKLPSDGIEAGRLETH